MRTKKAKLASKRGGQNRRDDVDRYANGRIDYGGTANRESVMAVVTAQRMKYPGVVAGNANSATAGTVIGRMLLQEEINETQYKAAKEFEKRRAAYLAAIQAPRSPRSGSDIGYIHEEKVEPPTVESVFGTPVISDPEEDYAERCERSRLRYSKVRSAAMQADAFGLMAMETIVCDDKMVEMLVGPMRMACNHIARELKIQREA